MLATILSSETFVDSLVCCPNNGRCDSVLFCNDSFQYYNPELPLVAAEVGPFLPGIYYSLSSSVSRAMTVVACPLSGTVMDLNTPYLSIGMYESAFAYNSNDLLPYVVLNGIISRSF